jgi:hypothetical protein
MTIAPLAVAETDRIAALLAEVMPRAAVPAPPPALPDDVTQNVRAIRAQVPPPQSEPPPRPPEPMPLPGTPLCEFLGRANWRNESPDGEREEYRAPTPPAKEVGPLPAPFGTLTVAAMFGLVNWRNRADEARPRPTITPPPQAGTEFTVGAMLTTFGWE